MAGADPIAAVDVNTRFWRLAGKNFPGIQESDRLSKPCPLGQSRFMKAIRLVRPGSPLELPGHPCAPSAAAAMVRVRVKSSRGVSFATSHYRAAGPGAPLPLTLGHEVAGLSRQLGVEVPIWVKGDRVCIHYIGDLRPLRVLRSGRRPVLHDRSHDWEVSRTADTPNNCGCRRAVCSKLPPEIPFEQGAIMMCSSATSLQRLEQGSGSKALKPSQYSEPGGWACPRSN